MNASFVDFECVMITALGVGFALMLLVRRLQRTRPELSIGTPIAIGYVLRLIVIAGVSATGLGSTLRGGDEITFIGQAHQIAALPWSSAQWLPTDHTSFLHVLVFAAQMKLLGSPEGALRITQVGISLAGIVLIVATVYDLAGPRAARLSAWLLSLEVASLFFNGLLHKEPNLELATGLVVFGGARVWRKLDLGGFALMMLGGLIALGTRQYVGWFIFTTALLLTFHAGLRQLGGNRLRSLPLIYGAAAIVFVSAPAVIEVTSDKSLKTNLQASQTANVSATKGNGGANGNNLALEQVNFSTRGAVLTNLPLRMRDLLLRPYPWQVGDVNQMLGIAGSLIALACWILMIRYAFLCRGELVRSAAPLLYPFFFLTVAYALAVGNAGTGFRYRTNLVPIGLAVIAVLRARVLERRGHVPAQAEGGRDRVWSSVSGIRDREAQAV